MKTTYGWEQGYNGTNSSGFSGLPGGGRSSDSGRFVTAGSYGFWWSSNAAWLRFLTRYEENVYRISGSHRGGYSVRCIKDSE
jgi:uncharacterized protein (TIGR02145 family)